MAVAAWKSVTIFPSSLAGECDDRPAQTRTSVAAREDVVFFPLTYAAWKRVTIFHWSIDPKAVELVVGSCLSGSDP